MFTFTRHPTALAASSATAAFAALASCIPNAAQAQQAPPQTIVITANPFGRATGAQPLATLAGEGLALRRAGTLGDTLAGLPGIDGTWFGPNASRPTVRGLDGDRIKLLDNGGASTDASALSFDHASATDPLVAERIEIFRGPAALLYGGSATGGVVNVIDNRIPRAPQAGLSGRAEARFGGAASERAGAVVLEGGSGGGGASGGLAWHADAYGRRAADLRVPSYTPIEDGEALPATERVRNSKASAQGGALGASWVGGSGYVGASIESGRNNYGVTVEPDVTIRMQRERAQLAGEWRIAGDGFKAVSARASRTRYEHREIEGDGEVGTTFKSDGDEARIDARHGGFGFSGALNGVLGVQTESLDFSALGEEAFVPSTRTRSRAAFVLEEWNGGAWLASLGARAETVRVDSPDVQRRFAPKSLALGLRSAAADGWLWNVSAARTERAPAYYELYADGVHVATAAYERGDPTLGVERSRHVEAGIGWATGPQHVKATLFETRFARYIALDATGSTVEIEGESGPEEVPEYAFSAVRARLRGIEVEGRARLVGPAASGVSTPASTMTLDATAQFDIVRGDNLSSGEPLPRLAPRRVALGLEAGWQGFRAGFVVRNTAAQRRVPSTDTATPGHTFVDLWASGALFGSESSSSAGTRASWFAKLGNAGNKLGYNAGTIATMRGLAPLPGRSLSVGVRVSFS